MIQYSDRGKGRIKDLIWYIIVAFPLKRETACAMHTQFCNYRRFAGCEVAV